MSLKNCNGNLMVMAGALALVMEGAPALGQPVPVVASFGRNGELVCTNLVPGMPASVEWAPSVLGPWTNTWSGLDGLTADSNGAIRVSVPMFYRVRGFPVPSNMVWIPPGTFAMGSPGRERERENDETQHSVTISRGFHMGKYEVTQAEYAAVMGNNPSSFAGCSACPVDSVSWFSAVAYCDALSAQERGAGRLPGNWQYRLPTEAEWEYACRTETTNAFHYGSALRSGMANFDGHYEYDSSAGPVNNPRGTFLGHTTAVGSHAPNAWGLYDMHGNVWEWCQDWYGAYPGGGVIDPLGPVTGSFRAIRGGGWSDYAWYCRSADRRSNSPADGFRTFGFRVVLAPVQRFSGN